VFAQDAIPAETEIGEYVGEIALGKEAIEEALPFKGVHCWKVPFGSIFLYISSERIANELAFVNDYRGIGREPNVRKKWILHRASYYFGFETIRDVKPGEELLVDYGKTWSRKISTK